MKPILITLTFLLSIVLSSCNPDKKNKCDKATADLIGELVYSSNPLGILNDFADFDQVVNNNRSTLKEGNKIYDCMDDAGNKLISLGFELFNEGDADIAYGRALDLGATGEQASRIRDDINNQAFDIIELGREILWLETAIPKYMNGQTNVLESAGTTIRGTALNGISMMLAIMTPSEIQTAMSAMEWAAPIAKSYYSIFIQFAFEN